MTDDLTTWLNEEIAEDEAESQRCPGTDFVIAENPRRPGRFEVEAYAPGSQDRFDDLVPGAEGMPEPYAQHVETWDPRRVLAECDAKRQRVALHAPEPGQHPDFCGYDRHELPCPALRLEALPYADRPGYREEWRPDTPE